jgi:hypothetical protein
VLPDPDLVIRTSGEARISNFLLWQSAYSEYEFIDTLWPDFTPTEFERVLAASAARTPLRRCPGLSRTGMARARDSFPTYPPVS